MDRIRIGNKELSYLFRWLDNVTFAIDVGYGDGLKDSDNDDYFIHIEYHADTDNWIREVWFEDDYLSVDEWKDYDQKKKSEYDEIIAFAKTLI